MYIFPGGQALSDFRKKKLLTELRKVEPSIKNVEAQYIHFVDAAKISQKDRQQLIRLLDYGEAFSQNPQGKPVLVGPRPGTISPWSSKATDIAKNSGLKSVKRIERGTLFYFDTEKTPSKSLIGPLIHDQMTEIIFDSPKQAKVLFASAKPRSLIQIDIMGKGKKALAQANKSMGLALSEAEIEYLFEAFSELGRNPTDVELMMFGVVNSEHARHKIFNANWTIDGQRQPKSLFDMIKNTYVQSLSGIKSAYSDNAAVLAGPPVDRFVTTYDNPTYHHLKESGHLVAKVETHNHPTAISPAPGAATGVGGEIRDEAATGRGAKSKAGFCGYSVSNLFIPGAIQPWEKTDGKPDRISSALDIMIEAPIGGASYANEFGRPNLAGYFRSFEDKIGGEVFGYHKPIMLAGGVGTVSGDNVLKAKLAVGDKIIVLGGPAMLIGIGGGAASSMEVGHGDAELDFASVQRGNAEMERRTQEVIDRCWILGKHNPIVSIHDVGAGGLSNALPELVKDSGLGASFELRDIPNADEGLSPMEIWCNEAQERYVLAIKPRNLKAFAEICERERCPFAVVGEVKVGSHLVVNDEHFKNQPVDVPLDLLFGNPPKLSKEIKSTRHRPASLDLSSVKIVEAVERVLKLPAVGSKKFLITIGDRTVGGLSVRDQMVGPWQVPVSDVAVVAHAYESRTGEAVALGERTPLALIDSAAAARMAVGEVITNIAAANVRRISDVKLSANWMAAADDPDQDQKLFAAVQALGEQFCPALGIAIPVGKDSMSMRTKWEEAGKSKAVTAPVSVIVSGFAPVPNTKHTLTPQLLRDETSTLILVDLGMGKARLGGSALAQVYNQLGNQCPDIEPATLKHFFEAFSELKNKGKVLAYHDRSDGGLLTAVCEMAFAGRCGVQIDITDLPGTSLEKLFNEELGVLIQVKTSDTSGVIRRFEHTLSGHAYAIGSVQLKQELTFEDKGKVIYRASRSSLEKVWSDTSYQIQRLRDNPKLADEEFVQIENDDDPGLSLETTFRLSKRRYLRRPKVAIFREQGVNGQVEMATAFAAAGFRAVDVHLSDISAGRTSLEGFKGLVACGGFSYGDVLGAGEGWAKSILFSSELRRSFTNFFTRLDTFSLGVCNGCQMFAALKELIPGTEHWPRFLRNSSEQFEARLVMAQVNDSPSILFKGMNGSRLPIPVAHGEGRAELSRAQAKKVLDDKLVPLQFIDNYGQPSETYPSNPNGSPLGITGLTSLDGRATILMPHPERVFLPKQLSWFPKTRDHYSPWFKIYQNARAWVN